jgi:hypothetical protein
MLDAGGTCLALTIADALIRFPLHATDAGAEAPRSSADGDPAATFQPQDRGGVCRKDRRTTLPESFGGLDRHLQVVRRLHARDRWRGLGGVSLPDALAIEVSGRGDGMALAVCVSGEPNLP